MCAHDVFISYSRINRPRVRWVLEGLRSQGWRVFLDEQIPAALDFEDYLFERVGACKCLVVVWSAESVASDWVKKEVQAAIEFGKLVVPIRIDNVLPPDEFSNINVVDLSHWEGNVGNIEWKKALEAVASVATKRKIVLPTKETFDVFKRDLEYITVGQFDPVESGNLDEEVTVIRAMSKKDFDNHVHKLSQRKYVAKIKSDDLAVLVREKKFNWVAAVVSAVVIVPLIIYIHMYKRTPARHVVKVVLIA